MASVDFSRDNLATLCRDGISDELYKLLWARDELNFGPQVNIPDTIVYKYGQPVAWYFTSVNGRVKKKNKQNLLSAKIEEVFNKHVLGYDVIAYFITMSSEHERSGNDASTPTVIEYFDRTALKNFLYNHKKGVNGILQRFIEPKSTHNELIRAIWSPKLCLLERAENIHQLHDQRYGLYERCVVYEGPDYYFTSAPLRGPVLSGQLQKVCESIVSHVGEVTYGQKQVTRIVLNFKVDSRDKIWLLYSTSIRSDDMLEYKPVHTDTVERHLLNIDSVVSLPEVVNLNPRKAYHKILPKTRIACLSCNAETVDDLRYPVTYKAVIKHYDHLLHLLRMASGTTAAALSGSRETATATARGVVVPWPPDAELVQAAGGVGFGCLHQDDEPSSKSDKPRSPSHSSSFHHHHHHHHVRYKSLKDVSIPPMIAALHPKLTTDTFLRCKTDPLFQNKTLHVCEPCYLVYAEFTTTLLRMGGHLSKLLTPDVDVPTRQTTSTTASTHPPRPSSADWRAISTAMTQSRAWTEASAPRSASSSSFSALRQQHGEAKARSIGLRSSDLRLQPEVPDAIRTAEEGRMSPSLLRGDVSISPSPSMTSHGIVPGGLLDLGSQSLIDQQVHGYDGQHVAAMIAERERKFFKEVSLNPQLRDQHPLMHLIAAQQRLQLVDQQSGVLMSEAGRAPPSLYSAKYGRQGADRSRPYAPYTTPLPYAINGEIILPSALRAKKMAQAAAGRAKKREALRRMLQAEEAGAGGEEEVAAGGGEEAKASAAAAGGKASKQYRDFLAESLRQLESELGDVGEGAAEALENGGPRGGGGGGGIAIEAEEREEAPGLLQVVEDEVQPEPWLAERGDRPADGEEEVHRSEEGGGREGGEVHS